VPDTHDFSQRYILKNSPNISQSPPAQRISHPLPEVHPNPVRVILERDLLPSEIFHFLKHTPELS